MLPGKQILGVQSPPPAVTWGGVPLCVVVGVRGDGGLTAQRLARGRAR